MAIALENANLVWNKVKAYQAGMLPAHSEALNTLKRYLATQKRNPNLQFIPFAAEDIVTNGGYSPDVDACTIYACYIKARRTTGTTAAFFAIHDATDNSATTTTMFTARVRLTGQEYLFVSAFGQALATELTASMADAVGGSTEASAANAVDGFVIIGA